MPVVRVSATRSGVKQTIMILGLGDECRPDVAEKRSHPRPPAANLAARCKPRPRSDQPISARGMTSSRAGYASASSLECAPSLVNTLRMWLRTVWTERNNSRAIASVNGPLQQSEHLTRGQDRRRRLRFASKSTEQVREIRRPQHRLAARRRGSPRSRLRHCGPSRSAPRTRPPPSG